jgi:hypothetical protein
MGQSATIKKRNLEKIKKKLNSGQSGIAEPHDGRQPLAIVAICLQGWLPVKMAHSSSSTKMIDCVFSQRHVLQGQALMYTDLRERTYVMMNDEKVIIRRRGRCKRIYAFPPIMP